MTPLERWKSLKERYSTPSDSFEWWEKNAGRPELMVLDIDTRTKKARFRPGDDTPSVAFYEGLAYVDFGGDGKRKDPVDRVMEVTGKSFKEAVNTVLSWEGEECNCKFTPQKTQRREEKVKPYSLSYLRKMISFRRAFREEYEKVLSGFLRACSEEEKRKAEKLLKLGFQPPENGYPGRVFLPEFDRSGTAWGSYRYNREASPKGLLRAGKTVKNGSETVKYVVPRVLCGAHLLGKCPKNGWIVLTEGHTDYANLVAKGVPAVTTGSATTKIGDNISCLAGRKVLIFPDLDIPGMLGATKKALEIEEWNKKADKKDRIAYKIVLWSDWMRTEKNREKLKIPFEVPHKNGFYHLNKKMLEIVQTMQIPEAKNFPRVPVSTWKLVFEGKSLPEGYDIVDYLLENGLGIFKKMQAF